MVGIESIDTRIACPQYEKPFNHEIQVHRHLDQPHTKCHHQPTAFVDPADLLEYVQCDSLSHTPRTQHWAFQQRADHDILHSDPENPWSSSVQQHVTVTNYYQGAAKVVDQASTTFLDTFCYSLSPHTWYLLVFLLLPHSCPLWYVCL